MECPWCNKEADIPEVSLGNAARYQRANVVVTRCCHRPVYVSPKLTFSITKYEGLATKDDWGTRIKNGER